MGPVLSVGSLICLLCMLATLLLNGVSSEPTGGSSAENKTVTMAEAENGKYSEVEGKNINMKEGDGEKMMMDRESERELIFNVDYHGPTTHPPATPLSPKRSPGSGSGPGTHRH
ncbi:hypothetical protein KI387_003515 [Taxus chinensis]|uniref:Uncharacterized protein n=1 Tax=Taxus chinensis TaxID=29808 RepID=A0AA38GYZ1_TAXCH|nr:hypothetical protein KI387_003515 [Taxus chinensis]